jgi:hypothetical protein
MAPNFAEQMEIIVNKYLIRDPQVRKERALEKEDWILAWLNEELFSTTKILATLMNIEARAARTVLNRLADRGMIIRDEIRFMGSRAIPLWGITSAGLMHVLDPDEIANASLRHYSPGSVKSLTIEHALGIQECRLHCELKLDFESWTPDRLLPGKGLKSTDKNRWSVYPDAVGSFVDKNTGKEVTVAIEFERSRKTPTRYVEIIKAHLKNIELNRYSKAWYICPTEKEAANIKALFSRLIQEKKIGFFVSDGVYRTATEVMEFFAFKSQDKF